MRREDAKVLVVDDEEALRGMFAKWLFSAGFRRIRTAANGEEAVQAIRQEPIDVLITDVRMPVMDGVTLVRTLARQGERIHTIIFVSGFCDVDQREMYDLGVENFLTKPFRLEDLSAAIELATAAPDLRWRSPMEIRPRQTVHLEVPELTGTLAVEPDANPSSNGDSPSFDLGRGGFSVRTEEPLGLGKVSFLCVFGPEESSAVPFPELCGQGFVRWRSRIDQSVGIEFTFLESPGREWMIQHITETNPRSFIPSLRPAG